jgi:hypothetical protein
MASGGYVRFTLHDPAADGELPAPRRQHRAQRLELRT